MFAVEDQRIYKDKQCLLGLFIIINHNHSTFSNMLSKSLIVVSAFASSVLADLLLAPNIDSWPKKGVQCGEGADSFQVSLQELQFAYANNPEEHPPNSGIWRGETAHEGVFASYTIIQGAENEPNSYDYQGAFQKVTQRYTVKTIMYDTDNNV